MEAISFYTSTLFIGAKSMQEGYGCYDRAPGLGTGNELAEFCNGDSWIISSLDKSE